MQRKIGKGWRSALAQAAALVLVLTPAAALAVAGPGLTGARSPDAPVSRLIKAMTPVAKGPARVMTRVVWRGLDVDGDGAGDFANPTGHGARDHDAFGFGGFGASRDGGARHHEGVDYIAAADQTAVAPISGFVTKIGYAYAGDNSLKFVEITNPALGYVARAFYVDPSVAVGQVLRLGEAIGTVASLQSHYPGITNHVHLEILTPAGRRVDATNLILARTIRVKAVSGQG